jgi:uncharacterized membrane protein YdbT with pleckstrin-like domain
MTSLDPTIIVFFTCSYIFQGDEALKLQWFQVSSASCFCVCTILLLFIVVLCVALFLFVVVCVCKFQNLGRKKVDEQLSLTYGGTHLAHHFLQVNKGMP